MSPNAPVPPPPPPGGGPVPAGAPDGGAPGSAPGWAPPAPPAFAPSGRPAAQQRPSAASTPADGQPTVVQPAVPDGATVVQRVTPTAGLPTAAQPVVQPAAQPAVPAPTPPQRVRYATEQPRQAAPYTAAPAPARPAYHPPAGMSAGMPAAGGAAGGPTGAAPRAAGPAGSGGDRRSSGRRLGPGWIAFIALDVVLVVAAVVVGFSLLGGGEPQGSPGATASPSAGATQDAPAEEPVPTVTETFASETRNITCEMTDLGVTCSIAELATQPAPVAGCDGAVGYQVVLDADGVRQPCVAAGDLPGPAPDDVAVLPYGESRTVGGFTCDSANTGMTCRDDATGKGFAVAKAGIRSL
ncbi:hypothetical protein [Cellulosimicrobium sp. NPDC057127]|uniref:hypothetical protein n=1 Tax=Cellulosimicrobium sp. NPDC057127 TaxID=3346026 RepID=UPI00364387B0